MKRGGVRERSAGWRAESAGAARRNANWLGLACAGFVDACQPMRAGSHCAEL